MKVVIPGGSGQVGTILRRKLVALGHEVTILSRNPRPGEIAWDAKTLGPWAESFEGADAVINLAGKSVNCRYHAAARAEIIASRVDSTRVVGEAIAQCKNPPKVWLQASSATIYSHRFDAPNDEATGKIDADGTPDTWQYSLEVALKWEAAQNEAVTPNTRKVLLRSALTLSPDKGGVFDVLLGLTRKGLGGAVGNGKQFVSWIHEEDFVRAVLFLIEHDLSGPVNLSSPNPIPNAEFMATLRKVAGIPFGLPLPEPLLELGTWLKQTESELVLKSRRVVPQRLLDAGFTFEFPNWPEAARDLAAKPA